MSMLIDGNCVGVFYSLSRMTVHTHTHTRYTVSCFTFHVSILCYNFCSGSDARMRAKTCQGRIYWGLYLYEKVTLIRLEELGL